MEHTDVLGIGGSAAWAIDGTAKGSTSATEAIPMRCFFNEFMG
jgi:predicted secreted protein